MMQHSAFWGVRAASHYSVSKTIQRDPEVTKRPLRGKNTAAPLKSGYQTPAAGKEPTLLGWLCSRPRDADGQGQNLTTSNSPKLVHIGTDTDNVFL